MRTARNVTRRAPRTGGGRARWVIFGLLAALIVVLAACLWVGFRVLTVKDELEGSRALVAQVQEDQVDVRHAIPLLSQRTNDAVDAAGDPIWRAAEWVPVVGDNLRAVRLAAESMGVLVDGVAVPVLDEAGDGVFKRVLDAADESGPRLLDLAAELKDVTKAGSLLPPVREGIAEVADLVGVAASALEVIPPMLGEDQPRNYLLVFQNNAEAVGLGGSAAAQTLVTVDDGSLSITGQANSSSYSNGQAVDVAVPKSAIELYSTYLVDHINTSASRPHFPTMAELLTAWWKRDIADQPIDGVVSIDPIALQRVLRATGPITLSTGDQLTEDNAVDLLLNGIYLRWGAYDQAHLVDAFFASAAGQVFDKVATGGFDLQDMVWAVRAGIDEGNIMFFSADPAIQQRIASTRVSGVLPSDNQASTTVGVYFRDESTSKIDYYMNSAVEVAEVCEAGQRFFTVESKLHMDISDAAAQALPQYVRSGRWGASQFRTQVYVYGPPGTSVHSVSVNGRDVRLVRDDVSDLNRPVAWFETNLMPSEAASVTATFVGTDGDYGPIEIRSTPMINRTQYSIDTTQCAVP